MEQQFFGRYRGFPLFKTNNGKHLYTKGIMFQGDDYVSAINIWYEKLKTNGYWLLYSSDIIYKNDLFTANLSKVYNKSYCEDHNDGYILSEKTGKFVKYEMTGWIGKMLFFKTPIQYRIIEPKPCLIIYIE